MNLTSKRMLQFFAGCVSALALTASAAAVYEDSFESTGDSSTTNGYNGMPISWYKSVPLDASTTSFVWYADATDASALKTETQNYVGIRPIVGATSNLVLNLDTNGKWLSRTNETDWTIGSTAIYVDTLVKFAASEDLPATSEFDSAVKAAVFVDTNQTLWVYHKVFGGSQNTNSSTATIVSTNEWHRLTIVLGYIPDTTDKAFKIYLDSSATPITCAAGVTDLGSSPGPWFISAADSATTSFTTVSFKGTGMIDELVVTPDAPAFTVPSVVLLTLSFTTAQVGVTTGGVSVTDGEAVLNNQQIVITAKDWYQILDGGSKLTIGSVGTVSGTTMTNTITGTVSGSNGQTNTIVSAIYDQSGNITTGIGSYPANKVAAWAVNKNEPDLTNAGITSDMLDEYLFNVATNTNPKLIISSIKVATSTADVVITTDNPTIVNNLSAINGAMEYMASTNLLAGFHYTNTVNVSGAGTTVTQTVDSANGKFIKAAIK